MTNMKNEIAEWMVNEVAEYDLEMVPAPASVLDIGANVGAFALRCHKCWPEASIRCYEPVAENYRDLVENLKLTTPHSKLIQAYRFAVRSFNGRDNIFIGDQGVTCGFHQLGRQTNVTEKVMCVDAAEISCAELVKIDTEGCEVEIVSRLNLSRTRALVAEYHRNDDAAALMSLAKNAGLQLLEHVPDGETHGVLKFGRDAGVTASRPRLASGGLRTNGTTTTESRQPTTNSLASRKIYLAVSSHFSNHDLIFLQSMMQLVLNAQVRISFGWSCDPSVERARNVLTKNFLESDCTHLLFVDSDIAFLPRDVQRIISHDEDVVGGIYPLKTMDRDVKWCGNGVCDAANSDCITATAATAATDSDIKPGQVRPDGLQEVGCIGTGFMCIARRAFERMLEADREKIRYHQDWPPYREEFAFWRQTVREVNGRKRFLTEDWNFCYRYRELGGKIFADTQVILRHAGRAVWPLDVQNGNPFVKPTTAATAARADIPVTAKENQKLGTSSPTQI